jgi:hypothetical protein
MRFIEYVLVNEANLEDLYVSDDPTDNIELLHEMEWKIGKIIENKYQLNPKLYVNIIKRFTNYALESYDNLSGKFIELFEWWLSVHNIDDPHAWAEMVYDGNDEDMRDTEGVVVWGGITLSMDDVVNNMSNDDIKNAIIYNYGSIDDAFPDEAPNFLRNIDAVPNVSKEQLEDYSDQMDYWDDNPDEATDYISDNNLEDDYADYVIELIRDMGFDGYNIPIDRNDWIKGIEEVMYPEYYGQHGYNIESVIPDIEEAIDRLKSTDDFVSDADEIMANLHPDDVDNDKNIKRLYKMVGKAAIAISLSMNVMHTGGNILAAYGDRAGLGDVDHEFLTGFHEREIDDWRTELKRIIK